MTIVGFDFTKIDIEKKSVLSGNIKINNNISIKKVEEHELRLGSAKQKALKFTFNFTTKYEPDMASIVLEGNVLYIEKPEKIKEILDEWKKNKKITQEIAAPVLNMALAKCNIESLILSKEINLPPPIPLPRVEQTQQTAKNK